MGALDLEISDLELLKAISFYIDMTADPDVAGWTTASFQPSGMYQIADDEVMFSTVEGYKIRIREWNQTATIQMDGVTYPITSEPPPAMARRRRLSSADAIPPPSPVPDPTQNSLVTDERRRLWGHRWHAHLPHRHHIHVKSIIKKAKKLKKDTGCAVGIAPLQETMAKVNLYSINQIHPAGTAGADEACFDVYTDCGMEKCVRKCGSPNIEQCDKIRRAGTQGPQNVCGKKQTTVCCPCSAAVPFDVFAQKLREIVFRDLWEGGQYVGKDRVNTKKRTLMAERMAKCWESQCASKAGRRLDPITGEPATVPAPGEEDLDVADPITGEVSASNRRRLWDCG